MLGSLSPALMRRGPRGGGDGGFCRLEQHGDEERQPERLAVGEARHEREDVRQRQVPKDHDEQGLEEDGGDGQHDADDEHLDGRGRRAAVHPAVGRRHIEEGLDVHRGVAGRGFFRGRRGGGRRAAADSLWFPLVGPAFAVSRDDRGGRAPPLPMPLLRWPSRACAPACLARARVGGPFAKPAPARRPRTLSPFSLLPSCFPPATAPCRCRRGAAACRRASFLFFSLVLAAFSMHTRAYVVMSFFFVCSGVCGSLPGAFCCRALPRG
ncbi:hypothetical protein [Pandoravirus japonicus]|uniref:Uncharacterized protein n=1 Tax=Pandoravirus japonicus TaxID=2823154 RepID=A0A811BSD0_9VIRU|nr:hypothetical protein [Pandoravirus japonicus]